MTIQPRKIKSIENNCQVVSSDMQKKHVASNTSAFPMKRFKGTKDHLKGDEDLPVAKKKRKVMASPAVESQAMTNKTIDPLKVMSKLEEFSDVWNDCPSVDNPKSDFEIVPFNMKDDKKFIKENRNERQKKNSKESKSLKNQVHDEMGNFQANGKYNHMSSKPQAVLGDKKSERGQESSVRNDRVQVKASDLNSCEKYDSKLAEMKRKKAVQEQSQLHADQKNIIKKALSSMGKEQVNKKIVFSDPEDQEEPIVGSEDKIKSKKLFEDDDESAGSDTDFKLKVNRQFEGKKGQKLMELQSKFASDSRFTLDSRFHESESEDEKDEPPSESVDIEAEKKRQLEILESIVQQPIKPYSETRKKSIAVQSESLMVRYDPTREDHQKYLLKPQKSTTEKDIQETKKKNKNENKTLPSKPQVSSEKIYAVKEDLKEVLKKENKTEFSLLKLFGSKEEDSSAEQEESTKVKKLKYSTKNPFKYDSSESESEDEEKHKTEKGKEEVITTKPSIPSWRTTFFFTENDSRLKEADEFLKLPEEQEGDQEFAEKRKMLKDFIRHKFKNSNRKKDPFKKKLGGVKQKLSHKKKRK